MSAPYLGFDFMNPPPTTPQVPANNLRPTSSGCGPTGGSHCQGGGMQNTLAGLGQGALTINTLGQVEDWNLPTGLRVFYGIASVVSTGLGVYHGYKRNDSLGWALWWGLMGGLFPIVTPAVAFAQGFGERA